MSSAPPIPKAELSFGRSFTVQLKVIGALLMRELHSRYGRENIGYLWVIGEPLTLASMITLLHAGQKTHYATDIQAVPFATMGYCMFIMFRGMWNRADGALEANTPLLYHRMVTVFDIMFARAVLELAGTFVSFCVIFALLNSLGMADPPARPLYFVLGALFMFWLSFALSLLIVSVTHDNKLLGRMVHPISYIMMPLSGAFYRTVWVPLPYRTYLEWFPLPPIFELCRYGVFKAADDQFFSITYLTGCCMSLTLMGLLSIRLVRNKIHMH